MSIEIGSKWVKDGEVVKVKALTSSMFVEIVWYSKNGGKEHVITKDDFLEQYKPYEPVYEYEYRLQYEDGSRGETSHMTEEEFKNRLVESDIVYFQRLDFTKKVRHENR